jgi:hypothetical protein
MLNAAMLKIAAELKASGNLSEFLEACGALNPMSNCSHMPVLREGARGNLWLHQMDLHEKGMVHHGGKHPYDHITSIPKGRVLFKRWKGDDEGNVVPGTAEEWILKGPCFVFIEASWYHDFIALTGGSKCESCGETDDVVIHCLFAIRDPLTGEMVPKYPGSIFPYTEIQGQIVVKAPE